MNLLEKFQQHWKTQFSNLSTINCQLLLAVSGGVDSIVLTDMVHKSGFQYSIAHCNFQLRANESERDENFVRSLGEKYGQEVLVKRFDTKQYSLDHKISIQEAARYLRYEWFGEIVESWEMTDDRSGSSSVNRHLPSVIYILTAHHADDNIETTLMHFFRGTGIQGLTGIQPSSPERKLLRPMLPFRKKELLEYATEQGLPFVEDSSNASDKYTRNFFRNELLPQIKEVFPQVEENLLHNIDRFNEISDLYKQAVDQHLNALLEIKGNECHIPVMKWKKVKPLFAVTWELIKRYGFNAAQTSEVIKLLDADNGRYQASATHRIIRNRKWMIISPLETESAQHILVEEKDKEIFFGDWSLHIASIQSSSSSLGNIITNNNSEAFIDAKDVSFPLLLRKAKAGDYFYPLGMQKKKKLSRFLIDLKLSRTEKEKVWILESNQKILWVIGYRIDNRYRITDKSKKVLHITFASKRPLHQ
jgi:tRNA(Ile)-lysidine synthase